MEHTLEQKFIAAKQKLEWLKNEVREGRMDWDAVVDYRQEYRNAEFAYENNGAIPMTIASEEEYLADMHDLERKNKKFKSDWGYENSIRKGDKIGDNRIGGKFRIEVGGYLFRAVTIDDWNRIQRQGYIDTDGRGAIVPEEEGINLGSAVSTAFSYLPLGGTGVILAIDPKGLDLYAIGADDYPRAAGRIPLKNVVKVSKPISNTEEGTAFIPVESL